MRCNNVYAWLCIWLLAAVPAAEAYVGPIKEITAETAGLFGYYASLNG